MWTIQLLIALQIFGNIHCKLYRFFFWELKPYIYMENGKVKGLIIDHYIEMKNINPYCPLPTSTNKPSFINEIFKFEKISDNYQDFEAKMFNYTRRANSNESTVWLPIINAKNVKQEKSLVLFDITSEDGLVVVCLESSLDTLARFWKMIVGMIDIDFVMSLFLILLVILTRLLVSFF